MKKLLFYALTIPICMNAESAAQNSPLEWVSNMRIVSLTHPESTAKYDEKHLRQILEALKNNQVNTIMDYGSLQFLPGLPHGKAQWKRQVNYPVAVPWSKLVKSYGFKLLHHSTSTFVPAEALQHEQYKQWISRNLNSGKYALRPPKTAYSDAAFMDMNHPGFRQFLFKRMCEYAEKCSIDGFMTDEVEWLPDIYAAGTPDGSQKLYRDLYNTSMPQGKIDFEDPAWRRYIDFRYASGGFFYQAQLKALRTVNPEMVLTGCLAGISKYHRRIWAMGSASWLTGWNVGFLELEEGLHPKGKRGGFLASSYYPTYYREMALYNAYMEVYNWYGNLALGYPSLWKVKDSEQFLLWAMCSSLNFRYWMRDYQAETEWFVWEAQHEKDLIKPIRIANVGVYFPEKERDFRTDPAAAYRNWSGLSEALTTENIVADQLLELHFEKPELLKRFDLIVLPADSFISDRMAEELYKFTERGGVLIAVGIPDTQDPFSTQKRPNKLLKLLGISSYKNTYSGSAAACQINGLLPGAKQKMVLVANKPGFLPVKAAPDARVIATVPRAGNIPGVIVRANGKGKCVLIPANWGTRMYSSPYQKKARFMQTADFSQRHVFGLLVKQLLQNKLTVSVKNLPQKYMFNAFDTAGHGDRICRTIHILDCFDGYEKNEAIAMQNRPCRFKALAERNNNLPLIITIRKFAKLQEVRLISPDSSEIVKLDFKPADTADSWQITVPASLVKRYTVIVCDPGRN